MELEQNIILEIQNSTTTFLKLLLCISSQPRKKKDIEEMNSYIFQGGRCEVSSNSDPQFSVETYIYQLFLYKI